MACFFFPPFSFSLPLFLPHFPFFSTAYVFQHQRPLSFDLLNFALSSLPIFTSFQPLLGPFFSQHPSLHGPSALPLHCLAKLWIYSRSASSDSTSKSPGSLEEHGTSAPLRLEDSRNQLASIVALHSLLVSRIC